MASVGQAFDHRFGPIPDFDVRTAPRVALKICELCRQKFTTTLDEALRPGEYISLQRAAGRRHQITCPKCSTVQVQMRIGAEAIRDDRNEMDAMRSVVISVRERRDNELARQIREEQASYQQESKLRHSATAAARERDPGKPESAVRARERWCKWRIPVQEAFREKQELTWHEIVKAAKMHKPMPITFFQRVMPSITLVASPRKTADGWQPARYGLKETVN